MNPSWGTKRNCPSCSTHFYDLNKLPAVCPKCKHSYDPSAVAKPKRKAAKTEASETKKEPLPVSVLANKKPIVRKKEKEESDGAGGISDIAEMDEVDDIENLQELSELEEIEETSTNEDDADEEALIEDLEPGAKTLVGNVEEEEAKALHELDDEEPATGKKAPKPKKKSK